MKTQIVLIPFVIKKISDRVRLVNVFHLDRLQLNRRVCGLNGSDHWNLGHSRLKAGFLQLKLLIGQNLTLEFTVCVKKVLLDRLSFL